MVTKFGLKNDLFSDLYNTDSGSGVTDINDFFNKATGGGNNQQGGAVNPYGAGSGAVSSGGVIPSGSSNLTDLYREFSSAMRGGQSLNHSPNLAGLNGLGGQKFNQADVLAGSLPAGFQVGNTLDYDIFREVTGTAPTETSKAVTPTVDKTQDLLDWQNAYLATPTTLTLDELMRMAGEDASGLLGTFDPSVFRALQESAKGQADVTRGDINRQLEELLASLNMQRQRGQEQIMEDAFDAQRRQLISAGSRGLGGSGLMQLAQIGNRMEQGRNISSLLQGLGFAEQQGRGKFNSQLLGLDANLQDTLNRIARDQYGAESDFRSQSAGLQQQILDRLLGAQQFEQSQTMGINNEIADILNSDLGDEEKTRLINALRGSVGGSLFDPAPLLTGSPEGQAIADAYKEYASARMPSGDVSSLLK